MKFKASNSKLAACLILNLKNTFLAILLTFLPLHEISAQSGQNFAFADRFGTKYDPENLSINSFRKPNNSSQTTQAAQLISCNSGYFELYADPGSVWTASPAIQGVLCAVLRDLSNFIQSPLSPNPSVGPKIRLYCANTPTSQTTVLGLASPIFVYPNSPNYINQGIIQNQIQKMIASGIDSYTNIPVNYVNSTTFYHGYIYLNPTPPNGTWNTNLTSLNVTSSEFCLYTVLLHELTHALGFASLIDASGASVLGPNNNLFSKFDTYLFDSNNNALLQNASNSCPSNSVSFIGNPSSLAPNPTVCTSNSTTCSSAIQYISSNVNVKVYTPNCFTSGSSLSHFEDMCAVPGSPTLGCAAFPGNNNDYYFVMSNAGGLGSCYQKRFLREEEKNTLCNIGYSVNSVFGTTVAGTTFTYNGSCSPINVWGLNDGVLNGFYTYSASLSNTAQISIPISSLIANDSPNTATLGCVEVVMNSSIVSYSYSGNSIVVTNNLLYQDSQY